MPYGPSSTAPDDDVREFELYFERLEDAGLGDSKRPDLLVFRKEDAADVQDVVRDLGGVEELPFTPEDGDAMRRIVSKAVLAVECENSLWVAKKMPQYGAPLVPQKRLGGRLGLSKSAVLPTVILKEEDREPLRKWQSSSGVPIHLWHVFYDLAFGMALDRCEELIREGLIQGTEQTFQAPGGATTRKTIYKFYYQYAYALGEIDGDVKRVAAEVLDKNGHILPYVRFEGGRLTLLPEALAVLDAEASR